MAPGVSPDDREDGGAAGSASGGGDGADEQPGDRELSAAQGQGAGQRGVEPAYEGQSTHDEIGLTSGRTRPPDGPRVSRRAASRDVGDGSTSVGPLNPYVAAPEGAHAIDGGAGPRRGEPAGIADGTHPGVRTGTQRVETRTDGGHGAVLRPWAPSTVSAGETPAAPPDRRAGVQRPVGTVSLDPGLHTLGEDGTRIWVPGEARASVPDRAHDTPAGSTAAGVVRAADMLVGPVARLERIDDGEARAFAGRFAMDYLSWDEDDPSRRPEVLRGYLADPRASTLGWSGTGRQRADAPLPGRLDRRSDVVVFAEVTLRVTSYARACPSSDPPAAHTAEPAHALGPSSAPAGDSDAWTAGRAWWVQMAVPVTRDQRGQLVVDLSLVPAGGGS